MKSLALIKYTQIHRILLLRFILVMALYSVTRWVFFMANKSLFSETTWPGFYKMMAGGLRFDLSALLFINAIYILSQTMPFAFRYNRRYQAFTDKWFLVTNIFFIAINCADIIYYRFILKRTTLTVFSNFKNETNLAGLFFRFVFIDYWYISLLVVVLGVILVVFYKKTKVINPGKQKAAYYYPVQLILMLVVIYFTVIGMRGGFTGTTRPITLSNAGRYVERPKEMAIVLNTPFAIFKTLDQQTFTRLHYFSEDEVAQYYSPIHEPATQKPFRKKNVVVFILESFGKEYFGVYNKKLDNGQYKGFTPFLDSLVQHSLSFKYSYANGWKSIDGIPSVISGIPSLVNSFVLSNYSTNTTPSLAKYLKNEGYETAFYHGAPNGSMGFLAYTTINGYAKYFGKTEFNDDTYWDGVWGIWDEEFFQFFAHSMNHLKKPFLSTIFSVSSHHPFKVPAKYKDKFPKGTLPMHQVVGYTDFAIRRFFETAKKQDWYQNTLFVFTADHTNQTYYKKYQTSLGNRSVPIIFFDPSGELTGLSEQVAQQIDIMPTVLGYLNYDKPYFAFGNNLLDSTAAHYAINTSGNAAYYQMAMGDYFLQYSDQNKLRFFNFKQDEMLTTNLAGKNLPQMDSMITRLKAFVQTYNNRMIDNQISMETN